ncbi:MAG: MraY family glycosyltransferase [Acidobacteriota bacterium]
MNEHLIRLLVALAVAAAATPLIRRLALRWSFVDIPGDHKRHRHPVPLMGGVAIYGSILLTSLILPTSATATRQWGILAAVTLVALVGLLDDRRGLPVSIKLLAQLAAAGLLLAVGLFADLSLPAGIDAVLTVLWIVGITNAFNLLDNMDGLAAGVTAVAAFGFLSLSAARDGLAPELAATLVGASLGFLIYNAYPARIFMGDAGSLTLGLLLAVLGLEIETGRGAGEPWVAALVPVLVLGVPIFDTTLVTVSRLRRGYNPLTQPGQDHLSHRLKQRGISVPGVLLRVSLLGCVCAALAVAAARYGTGIALLVTGATMLLGTWAILKLDGPPGAPDPEIGR